jgi:ribosome-associated toxin RatA of RatAB toxin-antitoxin module
MKELTSLDQKILNYEIEKVFPVVSDFNSYKEWFPKSSKVKLKKITEERTGSIIELKVGVVKFQMEMKSISPNKEIIVHYSGAYSGKGIWYFFENINGTKLMYEIDLVIKNPLVRFVSLFINIAHIHSKKMTEVFDGLEQYLDKLYNNNKANGLNNSKNSQPKIFSISGN